MYCAILCDIIKICFRSKLKTLLVKINGKFSRNSIKKTFEIKCTKKKLQLLASIKHLHKQEDLYQYKYKPKLIKDEETINYTNHLSGLLEDLIERIWLNLTDWTSVDKRNISVLIFTLAE